MSTILIADDSKFMRVHIKHLLLEHGSYDIIEAADGKQAINLYKRLQPDLVVLDITMPHVDGLATLKEIMNIDDSATVVMCSSMGTQSNITESLQLGACDFIIKPHFDRLIDILNNLVTNNKLKRSE
ncbi:two-component system chemotaxis response regulator CheY [Alkalibacillus filiformis]|uniref:Two-component system chemotaxis response regulator CheY n=1 Tax=Alkalibacillus filiformis TaxID=200990 RepID=A0ABU0DVA7_9BACI|nr:response regulator [Alkalibacillus filiformis]MDQ0352380.1 two-component system chemotaxis response regulator CheY [Alkalibacillus filiformis]